MKIIKFYAENIKKLKAIEITPQGNTVILSGKNEQGKTTVLDSIWWALGGAKDIQEEPIRQGAQKGIVQLDLGDLVVTRKFTQGGTTLEVTNEDGLVFKSPQAVLDKLMGKFTFDITKFLQASKKEQVDTLLDLVDIQVDQAKLLEISGVKVPLSDNPLDMLNTAYNAVFEERKGVNRDLDRVKKNLESTPEIEPAEPVSITDLVAEKEKLELHNRSNQQKRNNRKTVQAGFDSCNLSLQKTTDRITELKEEIQQLEKKEGIQTIDRDEAWQALEDYDKLLVKLKDHDLTDINERIASADETNRRAQAYATRNEKLQQRNSLTTEAQGLSDRLNAIRVYKDQLMAGAKFPIDRLNFAAGGVTYKGVPFEQASSEEKLRVSTAIAMAQSPTLRVIRIDNASLFDSEHLALIEQMAKDNDYQVWMEVVDESGKVGIVIEDGQIKETETGEAAANE